MTGKLRVSVSVSIDGYMAGPGQSLENPLGIGGERLHEWALATRSFREKFGREGGSTGVDDDVIAAADAGVGATVMGRNMFSPGRGEWDLSWTGWWGDTPPFGHDVFVLTHHDREPIGMKGGTTFRFVTTGIDDALALARAAAGDRDVRLGGGVSTVRECLRARLVDEMDLAVVPVLLGSGERLLDGLSPDGYTCTGVSASDTVAHLRFVRG
ncbi:bifunctional deaminase-reductase domain protein [Pseudonocardia dioxanivorans CB1190]|uniref:Bifunctional deaminase-reductase domain protein n=1 Tax=Pseudonocardia dioxanivorans (strain ATCC 55486 / DSM 44775 / JCM 13855 / CB1190) TaxID=675635 RepID=F4CIQ5_PSEUX|nr:dihydrofolate reductase family protein [Pseudonocardia dioxanivorans]AEA22650.1 bifunctional deaminase-reductase domain protein [Pseudonocardia dioxanivorans CB1190]